MKSENNQNAWIAQDPTDVELWYHMIEDHTFKTKFIPLPYALAETLVHYQEDNLHDGEMDIIEKLKNDIHESILGFENEKSAFVRLSTLSPKDSTLSMYNKLLTILTKELENVPKFDREGEVMAINTSIYKASRVENGEEAMYMFKKSARVLLHLKSRLKNTEPEKWNMNIVVREWNNIYPQYEFRGFVYKNQLTAITHYYKFLYVEEIKQNKEDIEDMIKDYFEKMKHKLEHIESYVIDFYVDIDNRNVKIIELNPFIEHSSSGLFNWEIDRDLFEGRRGFEFRILEEPKPNVFEELSPRLRFMLLAVRPDEEEEVNKDDLEIRNNNNNNNWKGWIGKIKSYFS
jgi:hypothetical protein